MLKKMLLIGMGMAMLLSTTASFAGEVFVTKQGKKYHYATCALIKNRETTAMDEAKAIAEGFKPCQKCVKAVSSEQSKKIKADGKEKK